MLAAAAIAGVGVFWARSSRQRSPVVEPALLKLRVIAWSNLVCLAFSVGFAANLVAVISWIQQVWQYSALRTGLGIAPGPLMVPPCDLLGRVPQCQIILRLGPQLRVGGQLRRLRSRRAIPRQRVREARPVAPPIIGVAASLPADRRGRCERPSSGPTHRSAGPALSPRAPRRTDNGPSDCGPTRADATRFPQPRQAPPAMGSRCCRPVHSELTAAHRLPERLYHLRHHGHIEPCHRNYFDQVGCCDHRENPRRSSGRLRLGATPTPGRW